MVNTNTTEKNRCEKIYFTGDLNENIKDNLTLKG